MKISMTADIELPSWADKEQASETIRATLIDLATMNGVHVSDLTVAVTE